MTKLKTENIAFRSGNYTIDAGGYGKRINIYDPSMDVVVIGNFNVVAQDVYPNFPYGGDWFDYFTGDKATIGDPQAPHNLQAGEYHIYTSKQLPVPDLDVTTNTGIADLEQTGQLKVYPNPFADQIQIQYSLEKNDQVNIRVLDFLGREVTVLQDGKQTPGEHQVTWNGNNEDGKLSASGIYYVTLSSQQISETKKVVFVR